MPAIATIVINQPNELLPGRKTPGRAIEKALAIGEIAVIASERDPLIALLERLTHRVYPGSMHRL